EIEEVEEVEEVVEAEAAPLPPPDADVPPVIIRPRRQSQQGIQAWQPGSTSADGMEPWPQSSSSHDPTDAWQTAPVREPTLIIRDPEPAAPPAADSHPNLDALTARTRTIEPLDAPPVSRTKTGDREVDMAE